MVIDSSLFLVFAHDGQLSPSDIEVERNISFHKDSVWSAKLWRVKNNYTEMTLTWHPPANSSNTLCAFKLFYYRGNKTVTGAMSIAVSF